ncbi:MAG: T9SS type A sorting domain-containing protein [Bacteroidota bacterium]
MHNIPGNDLLDTPYHINGIAFRIHPNPTKGPVIIEGDVDNHHVILIIRNILGKAILCQKLNHNMTEFSLADNPDGAYFVEIIVDGYSLMRKILKIKD